MLVREFRSTPSLRQCLVDDVHVMYFRGPLDVASLEATLEANAELRKLKPLGIWAFNLAIPMLAIPDRAIARPSPIVRAAGRRKSRDRGDRSIRN